MHHFDPFIFSYIQQFPWLGYILVGLGVAIDGEPFLFIAAFLTYQHYFDPLVSMIVIYSMTILGDIAFYYIGTQFRRFPGFVRIWIEKISGPFDHQIQAHPIRLFILAKFAYGIYHALWARAGSLQLPLWKYIKIDLIATALWIGIIGGITYAFGEAFEKLTRYVGYIEISLLVGLVLVIYIQHVLGRWIAEKLNKE